jgi:hAT family C-terminal dimerisation region
MKQNIFSDLPSLSGPVASKLKDEVKQYLKCPVENIKNALAWWVKNQAVYPHLSWMTLDYLSIPGMCSLINSPMLDLTMPTTATSVDMEHVFSKERLVLSHVRNGLSVQSTCTLMCLGA